MKREEIDWKILRGSITVFLISIIISGSLIYGSYYFERQMQMQFNRANAEFRSISNRYLAVDEEAKTIKNYLPRFIKLYEKGVVGNEQRLNWVEILRTTGDNISIPSLNYQIESQNTFTPGFPVTLGKYHLYSSKMLLNMQLLHEGDFIRVLDSLDENARGTYSLSSCRISLTGREITDNPNAGNISAECELQWYTIRLADGTEIKV